MQDSWLQEKIDFINHYIKAENAAEGLKYDPNANVSHKNVATLMTELYEKENIKINRELMKRKITEIFDEETANEYIKMLKTHELYKDLLRDDFFCPELKKIDDEIQKLKTASMLINDLGKRLELKKIIDEIESDLLYLRKKFWSN